MKKILITVFLSGFILRLIAINQSLWLDEAITAQVVKQFGFWEIVIKFLPYDFHPPVYYWVMKIWTNVFGYSEIGLRMPSVIFSLLTGFIIYKIVRLSKGSIAGVWAAAFFLFNPLIIYYSQEARMYMLATFFLTIGLYFLLKNWQANGLIGVNTKSQFLTSKSQIHSLELNFDILLSAMFFALGFLTFYGSIFFISGILLYLLIRQQYKLFIVIGSLLLPALLIILPVIGQQLINGKVSLATVANWSFVLGKANLKNLLLIPVKFSVGRIDFHPKWLYYLIAGGWTGVVLFQMLKLKSLIDKGDRRFFYFLVFLLIFPIFLGLIVSFFTPLLQYFRFLYLAPVFCILLALPVFFKRSKLVTMRGVIVLAGFVVFSLVYLGNAQFHREDCKSLVASLPLNQPVYMIISSSDPVKYYDPKIVIKDLKLIGLGRKPYFDSSVNQLIIIPYTSEIHGVDYERRLTGYNYYRKSRVSFREVYYEIWEKQ